MNLKNFNIIISKKSITKLAKEEAKKNSCLKLILTGLSVKEILKNQGREKMRKRIKGNIINI